MSGCIALVVAAGRGSRVGGDRPKQYQSLGGRPILRHSLETLHGHPTIDAVRVVIHPADRALYDEAAAGLELLRPADGGAERQDSVRLGLESLEGMAPDLVLIHDAARPFVDAALVSRVIAALNDHPGAIPAVPVIDTLKREIGGLAAGTVERAGLWRAQTPQGFRFAEILAAHRRFAGTGLTDDAAVAERAGLAVALVDGSEDNVKVTTPADFHRAESKGDGEFRSGTGFDVHRFANGDHVMLCGVALPHEAGLAGHSDADVGLHALTDALLGAIADGDIGSHFPPTDPQWRGAASDIFLAHAGRLVADRGGRIVNVDVTLICEAPRVGPHRQAMRERIAAILGIAVGRVAVKGTTTERLGFAGRREGIAAQAAATVWLPSNP
ncbi:MAG: bifunctional 2-C-methyl-D-erythritol 4-phosphate cytidylyltransferase/2-C-methyl-D-erythritol 2,4-cyclodiphosphate synthase [Rhodospirillales bacterium]|nr:bifunctional 2-C-methyl-D-erythritol 4-phosphate cytidylyltransferase/2-C-methyl-D-erythritol 2,4-cyclodiphosphate synthase [Rhodospirillales bacterium]